MTKRKRAILIGLTFWILLSCARAEVLPTLTPTPTAHVAPPATEATAPTAPATQDEDGGEPEVAPADNRQLRINLLRATVQIVALVEKQGQLQTLWTGSGTILTPDGLILTNAHVATDPDPRYQPDALGVAITVRSDDLPEMKYLAEVLAINADLDLAVIQIVSDLSGKPVDVDALNLSHVDIGDSNDLELGDLVQILGYPGIGGETITFTEGVVSGFTREPGVAGRAYIKTDATIAGGNSGGLAANLDGRIIGVPTQVGYGGAERFADCRYLADTNSDGEINELDNCIPVGGFINAIRPVNLAKPLVEAARLGIAPKPSKRAPADTPSAAASFDHLVFSPEVTELDQPSQIVTQLPADATQLYACWEYSGMEDGTSWEARWYREDAYLEDVSWPPAPWKGGAEGSWWVSITNEDGLTPGEYHVELYLEEALMAEASIPVGAAESGPAITDLIFSAEITEDNEPVDPTYLLPAGIQEVYAFFAYDTMREGASWQRIWYYEDREIASKEATWETSGAGTYWLGLGSDDPLEPGAYRLELYVEGQLLAASNFTVAGTPTQEAIGTITFAAARDAQGEPVDVGSAFPAGLTELYYFVDYVGMQNGMRFDERWLFDGEELLEVNLTWDEGASGTFSDSIYRKSDDPLWEGEYTLELYVEDKLVQQASARIGGETPPPNPPAPVSGLWIQGYIFDVDTGKGIPGAVYIVLRPGVGVDDWDGDEADVYTSAEAGSEGYFELPDALEREQTYSIVVWAEGYRPVVGDDILIEDEASPLEVEIELQQESP